MTKIYKFQDDISPDVLKKLEKHSNLAVDTEGSGLQIPHRDKLSLIQFSTGNNDAYIIQPNRKNYKAPNVVKILENNNITKIGHYLRYDVSGLQYFLNCEVRNIWCSKIASRLCRTYTQNHGLKDLVQEFCGKKIDKRLGSSTDWNKNLDELTDAQLQYCSNDVIYLHKIKEELYKMLVRENRLELYESSIKFLKTRIKLDQSGFTEDIFQH
jgi:ribonuclease D|tara:strand:- start:821 stop:1456 length:636 start_codon:yes stop_codon:yes gene_type:complete